MKSKRRGGGDSANVSAAATAGRGIAMPYSQEDAEAGSFFANQMLVHTLRNLVANGLWDENAARTNVQESIDQGTVILGEEHHQALVRVAKGYEEAVRLGSSLKEKWGK